MPRSIVRGATLALATMGLAGCIVFVGPRDADGELRDLVAARALWNANGVSDYDMVVRALCFCVYGGQPTRVSVRGGRITSAALVSTGQSVDVAAYRTVEALFDTIEDAVERNAVRLEARYDATRGFPTLFQIDYSEMIADEEYGHEIVMFTPFTR